MYDWCVHLLFTFRQVDDATWEYEVVSAHYRNYARYGPLVFPSTHGNELAACRGLVLTLSEESNTTIMV